MKRRLKRKMAPACHSLPRRICFKAIPQIEAGIRKPGRIWKELFANRSCSGRRDGTRMSLETIEETSSSPSALLLRQSSWNSFTLSPPWNPATLSSWVQCSGYGDITPHQTSSRSWSKDRCLAKREPITYFEENMGRDRADGGLFDELLEQLMKPSVSVHL